MVCMMVAMSVSEAITDKEANFISYGLDRTEETHIFQDGFNKGKIVFIQKYTPGTLQFTKVGHLFLNSLQIGHKDDTIMPTCAVD